MEAAFGEACRPLLLRELAAARREIKVAIYLLTDREIAQALLAAVGRGVRLEVKYDASKARESETMREHLAALTGAGAVCRAVDMRDAYANMHHKFVVFDGSRVFTGSYNFTVTAARASYENGVLIESRQVATAFLEEYDRIVAR